MKAAFKSRKVGVMHSVFGLSGISIYSPAERPDDLTKTSRLSFLFALRVRYTRFYEISIRMKKIAAMCGCVLAWLCLPVSTIMAQTLEPSLIAACNAQISAKFRQWRLAPVSRDVEQFAKSRNVSPTRVSGDFDGDGRADIALLVFTGPVPVPDQPDRLDGLHIAVCMNTRVSVRLFVIDRPYCGDGIAVSRRGGQYYDFERQAEGKYKLDGVHAYCFEKAGATYQFENGSFRQIVDSD